MWLQRRLYHLCSTGLAGRGESASTERWPFVPPCQLVNLDYEHTMLTESRVCMNELNFVHGLLQQLQLRHTIANSVPSTGIVPTTPYHI